ncbi:MAG: hypothetical protein MZU84_02030 [Sphingobacterium sp.]|nr:hypothetical protein [Sphingobacterium sp.]
MAHTLSRIVDAPAERGHPVVEPCKETGPMEVTAHLTEKAQRDYKLVLLASEQGDQKAYAELLNNYRDSLYLHAPENDQQRDGCRRPDHRGIRESLP